MGRSFDIVAYTYRADIFHPECIAEALPTGNGETFDGWADATGTMDSEEFLDGIAEAFGIDREDEATFDSGDFPKTVFADGLDAHHEDCGECGGPVTA